MSASPEAVPSDTTREQGRQHFEPLLGCQFGVMRIQHGNKLQKAMTCLVMYAGNDRDVRNSLTREAFSQRVAVCVRFPHRAEPPSKPN